MIITALNTHTHTHTHSCTSHTRYEMLFKQAVCTEDLFLGMGNKSPLTSACEELLVSSTLCSESLSIMMLSAGENKSSRYSVQRRWLDYYW